MLNFAGFNFDAITMPKGSPGKMAGSDGVISYGGHLVSGERNAKLIGAAKWVTYDNALQGVLPVAAAFRAFDAFLGSANWTAEPNKRGGRKAQKMADIATEGLLEAPMPKPWSAVVRRSGTGSKFKGFALHEWQGARRNTPGRPWWFTNVEDRPPHTIEQWVKPNEREPWIGVVQRLNTGSTYPIARGKLFHVADDVIGNSPEGTGYLRHLVEASDRYKRFRQLEGHGFETNLAGMPIGWAPYEKLRAAAVSFGGCAPDDHAAIQAFVNAQTKFLDDLIENHIANPSRGIVFESKPYASADEKQTPTQLREWGLEVVKATGMEFEALAAALRAVGLEILRVVGCEWLYMGDSEGARSVHESKALMFALIINSLLKQIGYYATAQLAYPMTVLNGFDPDTCTPQLRPSPIPMESIESVTNALAALAKARGPLPPDWEGANVILARAELPPIELDDMAADAMLPRAKEPALEDKNGAPVPADQRGEDDDGTETPGAPGEG